MVKARKKSVGRSKKAKMPKKTRKITALKKHKTTKPRPVKTKNRRTKQKSNIKEQYKIKAKLRFKRNSSKLKSSKSKPKLKITRTKTKKKHQPKKMRSTVKKSQRKLVAVEPSHALLVPETQKSLPKIPHIEPASTSISTIPLAPVSAPLKSQSSSLLVRSPIPPAAEPISAQGSVITPALELLPEWEDRLKLKRVVFEDGLTFSNPTPRSTEFNEANHLISKVVKNPHTEVPGHFIICVKNRVGQLVGALDGHILTGNTLVVWRSCVRDDKIRELHILLYAAALTVYHPSYVIFSTDVADLTLELAARLILLGRGFGMSAIPSTFEHSVVLIRRMKKELHPISSGQEVAQLLRALKVFGYNFYSTAAELEKKEAVALIPLPTSPDTREHLHELHDLISMLGFPARHLDAVLETLRTSYVMERKDISPALIF